jgi:HSP20 family protein
MFGLVPFGRRANNLVGRNEFVDLRTVMDDFFNDSLLPSVFKEGTSIRADIRETEKEFFVEADIPGVNKDDIRLELKDDILTIGVERKVETNEEKDNYIRRERRYGTMSRSFYVQNVKGEEISAKFENGVLQVILPKAELPKEKKHKIDIN